LIDRAGLIPAYDIVPLEIRLNLHGEHFSSTQQESNGVFILIPIYLRAIIRELNEYFARAISIRGQRRIIQVSPLHEFDLVLEASNPYLPN
jgi:hypothetical protein